MKQLCKAETKRSWYSWGATVTFLPSFPRKSLRLILQSLHKHIAADRVHEATMNLLSLFVNAEQQSEKRPS
jgi:hypothetical protein